MRGEEEGRRGGVRGEEEGRRGGVRGEEGEGTSIGHEDLKM